MRAITLHAVPGLEFSTGSLNLTKSSQNKFTTWPFRKTRTQSNESQLNKVANSEPFPDVLSPEFRWTRSNLHSEFRLCLAQQPNPTTTTRRIKSLATLEWKVDIAYRYCSSSQIMSVERGVGNFVSLSASAFPYSCRWYSYPNSLKSTSGSLVRPSVPAPSHAPVTANSYSAASSSTIRYSVQW